MQLYQGEEVLGVFSSVSSWRGSLGVLFCCVRTSMKIRWTLFACLSCLPMCESGQNARVFRDRLKDRAHWTGRCRKPSLARTCDRAVLPCDRASEASFPTSLLGETYHAMLPRTVPSLACSLKRAGLRSPTTVPPALAEGVAAKRFEHVSSEST